MSTTPPTLVFKRGDTVCLGCTAYSDDGSPADLTGVTVAAAVRLQRPENAPPVALLDFEPVNITQGAFELWAPGDGLATGWPTDTLRVDIQYTEPLGARTLRRSTETFFLRIDRDETP